MANTTTPVIVKMNIFVLKNMPEKENVQTIKLDVGAGVQRLGEADVHCNASVSSLGKELGAFIQANQRFDLRDDKF